MKQLIYTISLLYLLLGASSCQDSQNEVDGHGYLQLSLVEVNKTIVTKTSSSATRQISQRSESEILALDIIKGDVVVKHVDDWTQLQNESIELEVGTYILRAYSSAKDSTAQGIDVEPYYMGETKISIARNEAKSASITCTLAQSMVSLSYSDNFKSAFPQYSAELSNEFGVVELASTEARPVYMRSGKEINATLNLTNSDGNTFTYPRIITEKAERRYHYKVSYDITNEGTGDFSISVDPTTKEYHVTVKVPFLPKESTTLETATSNAWGQFAYLNGTAILIGETEPVVFQYRKAGAADWSIANSTLENEVYAGKTAQLDFGTSYEYRIACGEKAGEVKTFITETFVEIPNLNFDTWTKKGKNWFANETAADSYWASGNTGVTGWPLPNKNPITVPVEGANAYRGKAAQLTTLTGITLVKSAAGNLFIGSYATNMGNPSASVQFGRPYSGARPVTLSGYYKYSPKAINEGTFPGDLTMDECHIYIKLWDADDNVIAYGEFIGAQEVTEYQKFDINITYTDLIAKPTKITIVATSSHYGGEFKGSTVVGQVGNGSTLWIDEFELSYYK